MKNAERLLPFFVALQMCSRTLVFLVNSLIGKAAS